MSYPARVEGLVNMINNSLVKHNLETNHNFNFNNSKMLVYIHNKPTRILLNLVYLQTTILCETRFFRFISLFDQIGAEKLQNTLFEIIQLHCLYVFGKIDEQRVKLNRQREKEKS